MSSYPYYNATTASSSTTTQTQAAQGSRIPIMASDPSTRSYPPEHEATQAPAFTRTGSYVSVSSDFKMPESLTRQYETGITQPQYQYLQASDVRRQVQEAPTNIRSVGAYPKTYHNQPPEPLRAQPPFREYPVVPSPANGSPAGNYTGGNPGPTRAFYNNNDRSTFDVGYHDSTRAPLGPRNGRAHTNTPYSLAKYVPAPDFIDTSTLRRPS